MSLLVNETLIPLDSVQDFIDIKDLNKDLRYKRVVNPADALSDYFLLFFKEEGAAVWNTKNGLLSKEFTIAKTEKVLTDIITNLSTTVVYRKNKSFKTFSIIDFTLTDLSIINEDLQKDDKLNLFLFKLMSSVDPANINSNTELSFSIVNAFGGEHTLYMSYGLMTKFTIKGQTEPRRINNLLVLNNYSTKLIHNAGMSIDITNIIDVKKHISEKIKKWKAIKIGEVEIKYLEEKFNKKFFKTFINFYNTFPAEISNLFYVSYLLSFLIENEKNVNIIRIIAEVLNELENRYVAPVVVK